MSSLIRYRLPSLLLWSANRSLSMSCENKDNNTSYEIKHDTTLKQYYIDFPNEQCRAFINYRLTSNDNKDRIIIEHTEVPSKLAGKGIGAFLAKNVLKQLTEAGLQIEIECSFAKKIEASSKK